MQRAIRLSKRAKGTVVAVIAAGCAVGVGVASCVTAGPPDVPTAPPVGPIIIQNAVQPSASAYLTSIPSEFIVPVRVFDPNQSVACQVFVDLGTTNDATMSPGCFIQPGLEAGTAQAEFMLYLSEPNTCHTIQCFVANSFLTTSSPTPGTILGADSVVWQYTPNGPGGCDEFDGGDGAFPADTGLFTPDVVVAGH